jgi:hypothetical protein
MTDITYTYEIIAVDEPARCMEIVYTSEKYGVVHVGARLPFEGETVEQVPALFALIQEWRMRDLTVIIPQVGTTGQLTDKIIAPQADIVTAEAGWSQEDEAAFQEQINAEAGSA